MYNVTQHTKTQEAINFLHEASLLLLQTEFIVIVLENTQRT